MYLWCEVYRLIGVSQRSSFQLCCPKIHTRGQVGSTTTTNANATRSCTTSLAHATRARVLRGSLILSGRLTAPPPPKHHPEPSPIRSQTALGFPSGPILTHLLVTTGTSHLPKPQEILPRLREPLPSSLHQSRSSSPL